MLTWIPLARINVENDNSIGIPAYFQSIEDLAAKMERAQRSRSGNEARRRTAAEQAREYIPKVRDVRKRRPEWKLGAIIDHLRLNDPTLPSSKTMRRHAKAAGIK